VPLNERLRKDLTEFKSHVISFTDLKMLPNRKGFAGVKLSVEQARDCVIGE